MDSDQAKLFVGGISWETSEDSLRDHFNKYGNVLGSVIARDRNTGSPRGFGFVWFSDPSSADRALQDKHVVVGRTVEVKKAIPRSEQHQNQHPHHSDRPQGRGLNRNSSNVSSNNQFKTKKIFVGGLAASLTEEEFRNYFERFGRIMDVVVMHDSTTHRPRGFGFITFDSEDSVENVMQKNFHELNGKSVEVKRAVPKEGNNNSNNSYNTRMVGSRGSPYNGYQHGTYPPYSPTYGVFSGYAPLSGYNGVGGYLYGAGAYGGGYLMGGYGGIGYGMAAHAPRSPWSGPGMVGARGYPLPYGSTAIQPASMNGGFGIMGVGFGGYNGILRPGSDGKLNQVASGDLGLPADARLPQTDGGRSDVHSSASMGSISAAYSIQNQRSLEGQVRPCPVANSS
ncbi:heterogeneous nuclear ribonucleoprotein 1-like [Malania oleifera]|uniref:heterogeneous nuclear ribonucleoprotein 1-like n=1 Tax=Malania oleifera TaxID=397392 RepID=UPI0025AE5E89|nr:heterogeneous nuclear ribonucleoprotein 1-like [Malania oleifera]